MRRVKDMALSYPPPCGEGRRPSVARSAGWGSRNVLIAATPNPARFAHHPPHGGRVKKAVAAAPRRLLHRTILHVRIRVVLEHLLHDLGLEFAVAALRHLHQIEVLDRVVVGVELEGAAQRFEIGLSYGTA